MKKTIFAIILLLLVGTNLPAQQKIFSGKKVRVSPLMINTELNDVGPTLINNVLYYSSITSKFGSTNRNNQFFKLYSLPMNLAETPKQQGIKHTELNAEYHNGPITYCEATKELFITRSNFDSARTVNGIVQRKQVTLNIVIYELVNGHWFYKEDFPFNSNEYSVAQPAINQTGDTLVFVSDQSGSFGKSDLYITTKENGVWQKPKNMGLLVNSKKHETSPFISNDGLLYFASDGRAGSGGFDIFSTNLNQFKTRQSKNLGRLINTEADEFGLCIHPSQLIGYFVSNRKRGKGMDDLYCIKVDKYESGLQAIQKEKEQLKELSILVNEHLQEYETQKKLEKEIASNVNFSASFEINDQNIIPDLKLSFSYYLTNDTLKLRQNVFGLYEYQLSQSNALSSLLEAMKNSFKNELADYFKPDKNVSIKINGNPDALNLSGLMYYNGEFGALLDETYLKHDSIHTVKIETEQQISKDELSFLRAYAVKDYILSEIEALKHTNNNFQYLVIPKEINIEFVIKNAFDVFE